MCNPALAHNTVLTSDIRIASTVLYTCNNSGMHDVHHANQFGIVVYVRAHANVHIAIHTQQCDSLTLAGSCQDWSNAKAIWANAHPMSSEELITKQAEMVLAADPGVPGYAPRVWAYRNTIKALNWYSSVREKLDDPKCTLVAVLPSVISLEGAQSASTTVFIPSFFFRCVVVYQVQGVLEFTLPWGARERREQLVSRASVRLVQQWHGTAMLRFL